MGEHEPEVGLFTPVSDPGAGHGDGVVIVLCDPFGDFTTPCDQVANHRVGLVTSQIGRSESADEKSVEDVCRPLAVDGLVGVESMGEG